MQVRGASGSRLYPSTCDTPDRNRFGTLASSRLEKRSSWDPFAVRGCIHTMLPHRGSAFIAALQERDRRQRQLVDPQFSRMKEKMKIAYEAGVRVSCTVSAAGDSLVVNRNCLRHHSSN